MFPAVVYTQHNFMHVDCNLMTMISIYSLSVLTVIFHVNLGLPVFIEAKNDGYCTELYWTVLKIMDAGYCLYVHIFIFFVSLKPFNFNNSNQLMPDLRFQQSRRDN